MLDEEFDQIKDNREQTKNIKLIRHWERDKAKIERK
jgi:hypothetical protein